MKGSCLCGCITVETNEKNNAILACHCPICSRWGSGALLTVSLKEATIHGKEHMTSYVCSPGKKRYFCNQCGTHLFFQYDAFPLPHFNVGLFQSETESNHISMEVFVDKRPNYFKHLSEESKKLTEQETKMLLTQLAQTASNQKEN